MAINHTYSRSACMQMGDVASVASSVKRARLAHMLPSYALDLEVKAYCVYAEFIDACGLGNAT